MSMTWDLYPSGPEYTAPLRELILDHLVRLITEHLLATIDCAACTRDALSCPAHRDDALIAEDCRAAYLHLAATGAN